MRTWGTFCAVVTLAVATLLVAPSSEARPGATYPLDQTFLLHSHAGSKHTIFLDFNGTSIDDTSWATGPNAQMTPGSYPGFSLDGSPAFSDYEKSFVQQVWRRVAEMYSPFDVDVTTQDGGSGAYTRTSSADDSYGVQVVITSGPKLPTCPQCSGVAQVGSFDVVESSPGSENPAWVFTANTFPSSTYINSASLVADSAAHEVGHTFGLTHDGTSASSYYTGQGSWFPIMGTSGPSTSIGQWSRGEYAGANNPQDDLAVIAANGAPFRADDYATWPGTPTALGTRTGFSLRGVIEKDSDNDYVSFNRGCAGPLTITAKGIGYGATVDLRLTAYNAAGDVIATNNPPSSQTQVGADPWWRATGMDASLSWTNAASTTFRVKVEGVGHGDPRTTGYSGYGSIGQYTLTVSGCTSTPAASISRPSAPAIGRACSGVTGNPVNALARWSAPRSTGGSAVTGYRVLAARLGASGAVVKTYRLSSISAGRRSVRFALPAGRYKFKVAALNRVGASSYSSYSGTVTAR